MPLFNQVGNPLPIQIRTMKETKRISKLKSLKFTKDAKEIFHLSPTDFKEWIYLLDPREALILASTIGITSRIKRQLSYKRWSILTDWLWRMFH